ncbi:type VII secretion protein EccE [Mycolicibacterium sediminis]|uniref:ESX-3 secretion system protein EccE3 n=1 Tax=Mycolicibacterium sediminis TaxID=1286180 RepID=A0A7I7QMS6_9MYCO|nr:type VII secretion protein EccE [Mycolicibacterium sediminis]BBY27631.1 ESX-3 secretion system protein EccE3 [Mycolicibacterium sediminis]
MTARLTLALLVVIPAAMGYPWHTPTERWVLGVAIAVVLIVLAWWRGQFLTTMIRRRLAVARRNRGAGASTPSDDVTVLLSMAGRSDATLPLDVIAGYVERYGVRCASVRVTTLDLGDTRRTWVALTVAAVDNLAALRARSPELPLFETAEIVGRRLADHLRELGVEAVIVDDVEGPLVESARETWHGLRDDAGFVSAYRIPVDDTLPERLEQVWAHAGEATWTALEFSGSAARPSAVAVAAIRTDDVQKGSPVPGLVPQSGRHRPLLSALGSDTGEALGLDPAPLRADVLDRLHWPMGSAEVAGGAHARL